MFVNLLLFLVPFRYILTPFSYKGLSGVSYQQCAKSMEGVPGGAGTTNMDAGLFYHDTQTGNLHWGDCAVVIECKDRTARSQSHSRRQLKRAAQSVFAHQPRLYVWGLSIYSFSSKGGAAKKYFFQVHLYLRSGIVYSQEYALDDNPNKLCQLLLRFARMSPGEHGWYLVDPTLAGRFRFAPEVQKGSREANNLIPSDSEGSPSEPPINLHIPGHTSHLSLVDTLYVKDGLDGRATVILLCRSPEGRHQVVKLIWLSPHRLHRYIAILDLLKEKGLPGASVYRGLLTQTDSLGRSSQFMTADILKERCGVPDSLFTDPKWQNRGLLCVIGDSPGVSIGDEHSLKRVFKTFAEVAKRELLTIFIFNALSAH